MKLHSSRLIVSSLALLAASACDFGTGIGLDSGLGGLRDGEVGDQSGMGRRDLGPRPDAGPDEGVGPSCDGVFCTPGQRCEISGDEALCVDNACEDLTCSATERCEPHPQGGNVCVSIACVADVECELDEFCNGVICVADVCEPGAVRCDLDAVLRCADNGGAEELQVTCGSAAYFDTMCEEGATSAGCSCEDDWDCPADQTCDVSVCVGTGVAPTCTLDPVPFTEALPTIETLWGGTSRSDDDAVDGNGVAAPWPAFSHVLNTPVAANLDDDNGDGLIDERDFPELLFVGHQGNNPWSNGVLRAIHGGGPDRGADYFARCADVLWQEGDDPATGCASAGDPDADAGAPVAVGDLDGDGVPEIVYPTENNRFRILDNTGEELLHLPSELAWANGNVGETIALANLDYAGLVEVIVGRTVYVLERDGLEFSVRQRFVGTESDGRNDNISQMACPADVRADLSGMELAVGASLYRLPDPLPACDAPPCGDEVLELVWHAESVGSQDGDLTGDGYCAVADVWGTAVDAAPGPANPLDGVPEIILIDNGDLSILRAADGVLIEDRDLGGGSRAGAPNVDDFDGDGFPEVASALQDFYVVEDLQEPTPTDGTCPPWPTVIARATEDDGSHNTNPERAPGDACTTDVDCADASVCNTTLGACVCLHNGWRRDSDDNSSRATSSSVFDFNGDGAAEVLYNDECDFRVYDGVSGEVLFSAISRSRTGIENPIVADVDNDGNAEVITVSNTAQGQRCDEDGANPIGPNGIRIWGDPEDSWVSARRVWNQQSYHVTNVTEAGGVPEHAPESWGSFQGRTYNTYRSQPRSFGVAPDLSVIAVGVSSPDVACGTLSDTIEITFEVQNLGDLRVGPGVRVILIGIWSDGEEALVDGDGNPVEAVLSASLEPGRSVFLSVAWDRAFGTRGTLPDDVRVIVDPTETDMPFGAERECVEGNNSREASVDPGALRPDLRAEVGTVTVDCGRNEVTVPVTVHNDGTEEAGPITLRFYTGDPALGGDPLADREVAGPIAAGASEALSATLPDFPDDRSITIFVVVDPDRAIEECNEANNAAGAPNTVRCSTGPF